jgi:hypothetical protein
MSREVTNMKSQGEDHAHARGAGGAEWSGGRRFWDSRKIYAIKDIAL